VKNYVVVYENGEVVSCKDIDEAIKIKMGG